MSANGRKTAKKVEKMVTKMSIDVIRYEIFLRDVELWGRENLGIIFAPKHSCSKTDFEKMGKYERKIV